MPSLCDPDFSTAELTRAQLLAWLADGGREVRWALCSLPPARWFAQPPLALRSTVGDWAAARHVRHLALRARHQTLPLLQDALGETLTQPLLTSGDLDAADADWNPALGEPALEDWLRLLGETRFDLLQLAEGAADHYWAPLSSPGIPPSESLSWLLAHLYHHQLRHLAVVWQLALFWDQPPTAASRPVSLHPANPGRTRTQE